MKIYDFPVLRAIPNSIRGKAHLCRFILRLLLPKRGLVCVRGKNGLEFELDGPRGVIPHYILANGLYEESVIQEIVNVCPLNGVFLDVGANVGSISIPVAKFRPDLKVISIEADPSVYEMLVRNVERNSVNNVETVSALVTRSEGVEFIFHRADEDFFGMGSIGTKTGNNDLKLKSTTIDKILSVRGVQQVDVMKMDIEGAEYLAFQGAEECLKDLKVAIFEFNDWSEENMAGVEVGDSQRFLLGRGYSLSKMDSSRTVLSQPLLIGSSMLIATKQAHRFAMLK